MKRIFAKLILKFLGWRITGNNIFPKKCVIVVAPHTSNWDFMYGKCYAYAVGIQPKYLVKSELYFWPISWFINHNGGIPVDRTKSSSLVDQLSLKIKKEDEFMLTLSPEGTRSKVDKWKTGFYYVAKKANIPIVLAFIDFKNKCLGSNKIIYDLENFQKVMVDIQDYYKNCNGKYPNQFNQVIY